MMADCAPGFNPDHDHHPDTDTDRPAPPAARTSILANSYELQNELSNEKRFTKAITASLVEVRNGTGDGLFTVCRPFCDQASSGLWLIVAVSMYTQAHNHEENWGIARGLFLRVLNQPRMC